MERKSGKWIIDGYKHRTKKCSECGADFDLWSYELKYDNYCPNCGADMREVKTNDT